MAPPMQPARGRLLAATPDMEDPNFAGTVVLLLEHGPAGSLGVILNRRSDVAVGDALMPTSPSWEALAASPPVVFVGGPVSPNAVVALARVPVVTAPERWEEVLGDLGVIALDEGPLPAVGQVAALRIFAGYAGWGGGQLEGELEAGAWFVLDARPEDCFDPAPEGLWQAVLRRQGGLFTTATDTPVLN